MEGRGVDGSGGERRGTEGNGPERKGGEGEGKGMEGKGFYFTTIHKESDMANTAMEVQTPPYEDTGGDIDFDTLAMGSRISPEWIERMTGTLRGTEAFQFASMNLAKKIERELWTRNKNWTVHIYRAAIMVCTDPDAASYNARQRKAGQRKMKDSHKRNLHVNGNKLDEAQKRSHESEILFTGRALAAMVSLRKKITGPGPDRKALPKPEGD